MPAHRVPRIQLLCAYEPCASPFTVTPGEADRVRYCSPTCRKLARQQPRVVPVILICAYAPCSQPFTVLPWQAEATKFCKAACYQAQRKVASSHEAFVQRFWSKVVICEHGMTCTECCWPWMGAMHANGYGNFRATPYKEGNVSAHIVSWFIKTGEWPEEGLFVCHTCDFGLCVQNNAHLFLGTQLDNMQDCVSKGRQGYITHPERVLRGEAHPARLHPERMARGDMNGMRLHPESVLRGDKSPVHKLTEAQLAEAIRLYATGQWTLKQLGHRYGVTGVAVGVRIRKHKPLLNN